MNFFLKALTLVCFLAVSCSSLTAQEIASPSEDAIEKQATEENPILQTYSWLKKIVDNGTVKQEKVEVYNHNGTKFVIVEQDGKRVMYDSTGKVYCTNSETLKCEEFYKLGTAEDSWEVGSK